MTEIIETSPDVTAIIEETSTSTSIVESTETTTVITGTDDTVVEITESTSTTIVEQSDATIVSETQESVVIVEMEPGVPGPQGEKGDQADPTATLTLYPTTANADIGGYFKLVSDISDSDYDVPAVDVPTGPIVGGDQLISSLVSAPGLIVGTPGVVNLTIIGNIRKTAGPTSTNATFHFHLFKRDSLGNEEEIGVSNNTLTVSNAIYEEFSASLLFNDGTWIATDRIVLKFYGEKVGGGADPEYEFQFGGQTPVRCLFPVPVSVLLTDYMKLDQTIPQAITANDTAITAIDKIYFGDVSNSGLIKEDTVQGILDLVPAPDLSGKLNLDQTTPQTTVGTFTFPNVKVSGLTPSRIPFASTGGLLVDSTRLTMTTAGLMTLTGTEVTDGLVDTGKLTISPIHGTGNQVGSEISLTAGNGGLSPTIGGPAGGVVAFRSGNGGENSQGVSANIIGANAGSITFLTGNGGNQNSTAFANSLGGSGGSVTIVTGGGGRAIGAGPSSQTGGNGGAFSVSLGAGGPGEAGKVGGNGGNAVFNAGIGGNAVLATTATNTGGTGGSFTFSGGLGGQTINSTTSNLGGKGGDLTFVGGPGGQALSIGRVGNGGDLIFRAGQTGTSTAGLPVAASTAGKLSFTSGLAASTGAWGNHAGLLEFISSPGSTAVRAGVANVGGNGGAFTFTSGNGGAASTGTSNTGGNAGDMTFTMGTGGTGATANGLNAHMIFKSGSTEIARFSNTAGAVGRLGIGTGATVSARLHAISTTEQFRLGYDASNYYSTTVGSTGLVTFDAVGSASEFLFSDRVRQPGTFAEIYVADGSIAQSIPTGTTYTKLTAFTTNGSATNCTADATNDKITITKAGKYLVNCVVSGFDGVSGAEFKMALFKAGTEQSNIHATNKYNAGSEIDNMEMCGIIAATASQDIDVRLRHDSGGSVNFTTQYANLTITYIGE